MAYEVHTTKAFIVRKIDTGEENQTVVAYTEQFGLIFAHTQANRKMQSKLRAQLNMLALVSLDLVQGKRGWIITGVQEQINPFLFVGKKRYALLKNSSLLIARLSGEEANRELWGVIERMFSLLQREHPLYREYLNEISLLNTIQILSSLGYWNNKGNIVYQYREETFQHLRKHYSSYSKHIQDIIHNTQL